MTTTLSRLPTLDSLVSSIPDTALQRDSRLDKAEALSRRVHRVFRLFFSANGVAFYTVTLSDRMVLLFLPSVVGSNLPAPFIEKLRKTLYEYRIVWKGGVALQISYDVLQPYGRSANAAEATGLPELPAYENRQVVVYGPTGSGKTTVLQHLLANRSGQIVILDAHYAPGKWPPRAAVIGAGRNFPAIDQTLDWLLDEMSRRYARMANGETGFTAIHLAIDEMSAIAHNLPSARKRLIDLSQEGRKVNIFVILTPHSTEVAQMGLEGSGDARENYIFVGLSPVQPGQEAKPRLAVVHVGNPRRKDNAPIGQYLIPPSKVYQGSPRLNPDLGVSGRSLTVSEDGSDRPLTVVEGVSQGVSEVGHGLDTPRPGFLRSNTILDTPAEYSEHYTSHNTATAELAEFLAQHGFGIRKISEALPYAAVEARETARQAIQQIGGIGIRPGMGSSEERQLVWELHNRWGMPVNRLARLLDGNDSANQRRIETILSQRITETQNVPA